jgi:Kef-type K+ transport system membrane component KefB
VFIVSIAKIIPVALMTRLVTRKTETWSFAFAVGILMNTRGIVQLVVLNVGVELGVLSPVIFSIFVLMAIILTFFTSPLLYLVYLRKKPTKVKSKIIVAQTEKPPVAKRTHLYTNPIDDQRVLRPYRKRQLEPPLS